MSKACWIKFNIGLNFHSTSIQLFLCSRKCWIVLKTCWSRLNTLFNNCTTHACSHQAAKVNMASIVYVNCEVLVLLLAQCWNRLNDLRTTCWANVGQMLKPFKRALTCWTTSVNRLKMFIVSFNHPTSWNIVQHLLNNKYSTMYHSLYS